MAHSTKMTATTQRATPYQWLFAQMMALIQTPLDSAFDARKRALLSDLTGTVVEIGPGTGPNLGYYNRSVRWLGIEPNPAMFPFMRREAQRLGLEIDIRPGMAERMDDIPDGSIDGVVSTHVLCSVRDPRRALDEIVRVLKPGGHFVFLEHVAAPAGTALRRIQRIVKPVWKPLAEGCNPDRETWTLIERAGFSRVEIEHFHIPAPIVGPHIAGRAVK